MTVYMGLLNPGEMCEINGVVLADRGRSERKWCEVEVLPEDTSRRSIENQ